ncbi:DUF3088 domain-containing protein [Sphingomonas xinjiangensis]|uniref:DUF3088 family protein n=1 Tax=Sphingomonas xinjiangensis TaxID=643568 RepID=A0A840YBV8_9SPHN|nr:DUF3088 domain-containing protein [Sphingomonas xinjiangensis]MBB5709509.1 hypothetical protein [Sphingomonas xinjiangensis]
MTKDRLFVLDTDWTDPAYGGERRFYCKDCVTVEGLLAAFPERAGSIEVIRLAWPRPRAALVEAIGEANQNLPALVWTQADGSTAFVNDQSGLLRALHERHGFPEPHP